MREHAIVRAGAFAYARACVRVYTTGKQMKWNNKKLESAMFYLRAIADANGPRISRVYAYARTHTFIFFDLSIRAHPRRAS